MSNLAIPPTSQIYLEKIKSVLKLLIRDVQDDGPIFAIFRANIGAFRKTGASLVGTHLHMGSAIPKYSSSLFLSE